MKRCPQCDNKYNDEMSYCVVENTPLISDPPTSKELQADTLIIPTELVHQARQKETLSSQECPDKWLHEIADSQKASIQNHVLVRECLIPHHDLLGDSPFIDFNFVVFNTSVYRISLNKVSGSIRYGSRLLTQTPILAGSTVENLTLGKSESCVIRQLLSKEDAVYILSMEGSFDFEKLKVRIDCTPKFTEVEPKYLKLRRSISNEKLYAAYPKLKIEIKEAQLKGNWSNPEDHWDALPIGTMINLLVHFENPRRKAADIQDFKLDTNPQVPRITAAEKGDIYEYTFKTGTPLNNLNNSPIRAEQGHPFEGWLQFILLGVEPDKLSGATPRLIVVDKSGEEHKLRFTAPERG